MTLYMIGLGLYDEKDITIKGLEAIKASDMVYLENYTSVLSVESSKLENYYGKSIILADRDMVERNADEILNNAKDKNVCFLVVGDVFSATTHTDMMLRAKEREIEVKIINNTSILNAIGVTGLELYKFGKTTSVPFEETGFRPKTPYEVIGSNQENGLHTLCLLDIKVKEASKEDIRTGKDNYLPSRFMTVNQAIKYLISLEIEEKKGIFTENTKVVGLARVGAPDCKIVYGTAKQLLDIDFGAPLHSLIVPGKLHFIEEEALKLWKS